MQPLIQNHFSLPTYSIDLDSTLVENECNYVNDNIAQAEIGEFSTPFNGTTWNHYHNISPAHLPNICDSIIEHSQKYASLLGLTLEGRYTYWINQFYGDVRECSNDRHSHGTNKVIGVFYTYNNEPDTANLVIENPIKDTIILSPYMISQDNSEYFKQKDTIASPQYRLILFPGFVWHWANFTNNVDAKRISLALEIN